MTIDDLIVKVKKNVNRDDLEDEFVKDKIFDVINFIDNIDNWWFQINSFVINVNGNYILNFDLENNKAKGIYQVYYTPIYKGPDVREILFLKEVDTLEKAKMLVGKVNKSSLLDGVKLGLYGGFWYVENKVVKTYPEILEISTLWVEYFKRVDFDNINYEKILYYLKNLIINGAISRVYDYLEMYDIAKRYEEIFDKELQSALLRNKVLIKQMKKNEPRTILQEDTK